MKFFKITAFLLVIWIVSYFGIEFVCGFWAKNNHFKADFVSLKSADESFGYFKPNQDKNILFPGHKPYHLKINSLGFRDTGINIDNETLKSIDKRILCIGDSFTFGLFVDDEDTYPYLLQEKISKENKDAVVLNAGIGSTGINDHYYYLKERGLALNPDIVIVNFFGNDIDDLSREIPYYQEVKNAKPIKRLVKSNFFRSILGMYVYFKYQRWLSKVDDPKIYDILKNKKKGLDNSIYASLNYHTWQVIKDPHHPDLKEKWEQYFLYLRNLNDDLKDQGRKLIFVINPELISVFERTQGNHEDVLISFLKASDIAYVNLVALFKKDKENVLSLYNDPPRDFHLNKQGNSLVVMELWDIIKDDL
jgi:hypothetical protein